MQAPSQPYVELVREFGPQLANMAVLYAFMALLNKRSRRLGHTAARQEEVLLSACTSFAICNLLATLTADHGQDYVYVAFFLICTTTFLKIRWWLGTSIQAVPAALLQYLAHRQGTSLTFLPSDAAIHVAVAWAVGGLMSYLAESYRRQMFAHSKLAALAHASELQEAQARIAAQRALAAAQAQAAQRALSVAREKASNEAKSEFMSLMCHEVRTPLNGCLASAEMLLETPLAAEQRELAATIRVSGSILLSTVSNFLDFFKLEAGKALDVVRAPCELRSLVADVHCIIEAMIGRSGEVRLLEPVLEPGVPQRVVADPDRVRGILLNLYTNAAKFTRSGHIGLRLREVGADYDHCPPPGEGYAAAVTVTPATDRAAMAVRTSVSLEQSLASAGFRQQQAQSQAQAQQVAAAAAAAVAAGKEPPGGPLVLCDTLADDAATSSSCAAGSQPPSGQQTEGLAGSLAGTPHAADSPPASASLRGGPEGCSSSGGGGGGADGGGGRWLLFEVMDTGVGIAPEGLRSLFREYVQGTEDEMRKPRSKGGTGLGLSICSKQVGVLGGRIGAYSAPAKGSVFWFTIPLVLPAGQAQQSYQAQHQQQAQAQPGAHDAHLGEGQGQGQGQGQAAEAELGQQLQLQQQQQQIYLQQQQALQQQLRDAGQQQHPAGGGGESASLPRFPQQQQQASGEDAARSSSRASGASQPNASVRRSMDLQAHAAQAQAAQAGAGPLGRRPSATQSQLLQAAAAAGVASAGGAGGGTHGLVRYDASCVPAPAAMLSSAASLFVLAPGEKAQAQAQAAHGRPPSGAQVQAGRPGSEVLSVSAPALVTSGGAGAGGEGSPLGAATAVVLSTAGQSSSGWLAAAAPGGGDASTSARPSPPQQGQQQPGGTPEGAVSGPGRALGLAGLAAANASNASVGGGGRGLGGGAAGRSSTLSFSELLTDSEACCGPPGGGASFGTVGTTTGGTISGACTFSGAPGGGAGGGGAGGTGNSASGSIMVAQASAASTAAAVARRAAAEERAGALRGRRVLLVEDNLINQTVARKMLTQLGLACEVASNGLDALHAIERGMAQAAAAAAESAAAGDDGAAGASPASASPQQPGGCSFDAVLMDMAMPVMGGVDATRAIRQRLGCGVPILAMTANASDRDRDECRSAGMDGFLSKPVLKEQLADSLARVLEGRGWP